MNVWIKPYQNKINLKITLWGWQTLQLPRQEKGSNKNHQKMEKIVVTIKPRTHVWWSKTKKSKPPHTHKAHNWLCQTWHIQWWTLSVNKSATKFFAVMIKPRTYVKWNVRWHHFCTRFYSFSLRNEPRNTEIVYIIINGLLCTYLMRQNLCNQNLGL